MTIAEYFDCIDKGFSDLQIEQRAKDLLTSRSPKVGDVQELENYLNSVFYPTDDDSVGAAEGRRIRDMIIKGYEKRFGVVLQGFDFGNSNVQYGSTSENLPTLIRGLYEKAEHKEFIQASTVQGRLDQVKQVLTNMNQETATEELQAIRPTLEVLQSGLSSLITEYGATGKIDVKANATAYELVNYLDKLWLEVSTVLGSFTPTDYGRVLEWALQAASADIKKLAEDGVEQITANALEKMMNVAGSSRTGSGTSLINLSNISLSGYNNIKTTREKNSKSYTVTIPDGNGSSIDIKVGPFNEQASVQGKMDVDFKLASKQGTQQSFRISAKNWSKLSGRDFGETSVAYALLRQVGIELTNMYSYSMGYEQGDFEGAHKMAQQTLLLDILMGFAQENHYADTLVINDRASSKVIVRSMSDIIHKLLSKDDFKITQYDKVKSDIRAKHRIMWNAIVNSQGGTKKSENYTNLSAAYLNSVKVALTSQDVGLLDKKT